MGRGWIVGVLLCLSACAEAGPESVGDRGLGDADGVYGSCEQLACGEAAAVGNCWCDEACVEHGDCCGDKVDACGGAGPDPQLPILCEAAADCPSGLTCDTAACYSSCRDGEDCDQACLGLCIEPQQQSVPAPKTDHPVPADPPAEPDDDSSTDDAEEPEVLTCDCPADTDLCVPLCPVCPPDVPDAECQCTVVCVSL